MLCASSVCQSRLHCRGYTLACVGVHFFGRGRRGVRSEGNFLNKNKMEVEKLSIAVAF